jgi:type 1 glutamine amidotransferase
MAQQQRILVGAITVCSLTLFVPRAWGISPEEAQKIEAAAPARAPAVPAKPRKLLVFSFTKGYVHTAIPYGAKALEVMGAKTGAYEVVHSTDMSVFDAASLQRFDAICLNNSSQLDFSPEAQKAILDFVGNGKGIVGIHGATVNFAKWPEGAALLGGVFDGHPWVAEGTWAVKIDDPGHPLNAAFQGQGFKVNDELYRTKFSYPPRENLRVLVSIDMSDEATRTAKGIRPGETDYPLSWIRTYGRGRVFYTSFAHNHHLYWDPAILQHILAGVQFVLGDLAADTTPSAKVTTGPGPGFRSLFNGKDLSGWRGNPDIWSVQDGVITGRTTPDCRICENNFLIWTGGEPRDFELHFKFRLENGNSGVYFRSLERTGMEKEPLIGCQADFSADGRWTGVIMEYTRREILAERGQKAVVSEDGNPRVVGSVGNPDELLKAVQPGQWNQYIVTAQAGHIVLRINGVTMCELDDNDPKRIVQGKLALQVHEGPPMQVQFKDIFLREL